MQSPSCTKRPLGTKRAGRGWGPNFVGRWSEPFPGFGGIRRLARGSGPPDFATFWSAVFPTSPSLPKAGRRSASWPSRTQGAGRVTGQDGRGTEDCPRSRGVSGDSRPARGLVGRGLSGRLRSFAPFLHDGRMPRSALTTWSTIQATTPSPTTRSARNASSGLHCTAVGCVATFR